MRVQPSCGARPENTQPFWSGGIHRETLANTSPVSLRNGIFYEVAGEPCGSEDVWSIRLAHSWGRERNTVSPAVGRGAACQVSDLGSLLGLLQALITPEGFVRLWPHLLDTEGFFVSCFRKAAPMLTVGTRLSHRGMPAAEKGA